MNGTTTPAQPVAVAATSAERTAAASGRKVRLLVIVRSLDAGGAERQLIELLRAIDRTRFEVEVVCFYRGRWHAQVEQLVGVRAWVIDKRGRFDVLRSLFRLARRVRELRPDIIYGYMFVADVMALLLGRRFGARIVWGLRSSDLRDGRYGRVSAFMQWVSRKLAHRADLVISNSSAGLRDFCLRGARPRRSVVIPNGIDTERFAPSIDARESTRAAWGLSSTVRVIGLVGRIDPMKGHETFIEAAALVLAEQPGLRFVCAGSAAAGHADYARRLRAHAARLGVAQRLTWIDHVEDVERVYPALDVCTSASHYGEGFSNAIAEAMACAIPCVVTAIGDSAIIVGDSAWVVPPRDARRLADAWLRALTQVDRQALGRRNRARIVDLFTTRSCALATQRALGDLVQSPARSSG